jgi:hypothetical protein
VPVYEGLGGRLAGTFAARPGARRLATVAAAFVALVGALAIGIASRHPWRAHSPTVIVWSLTFAGITGVGLAVRRARVTVDASGVRWGWGWLGFRLERDRIRAVDVFTDAIAFRPRRGSTWFLTAWDWDRFDALVLALERSGLALTRNDRRAPIGARLQSYGRALDGLLVIAMLGTALMLLLASAR